MSKTKEDEYMKMIKATELVNNQINNFQTNFNKYLEGEKNDYITFCDQCKTIQDLKMEIDKNQKITFESECLKCKKEPMKFDNFEKFQEYFSANSKEHIQKLANCKNHDSEKADQFCFICNNYFCKECKHEEEQGHLCTKNGLKYDEKCNFHQNGEFKKIL